MTIFVSGSLFSRIPQYNKSVVGWSDVQGQAVSKRTRESYSRYSDYMDKAKQYADEFDSQRKEIDRAISEPEPSIKTNI